MHFCKPTLTGARDVPHPARLEDAKPKAWLITESEVLAAAALAAYTPQAQAALRAAGGRPGVVPRLRRGEDRLLTTSCHEPSDGAGLRL
jgi:hypothetical protein